MNSVTSKCAVGLPQSVVHVMNAAGGGAAISTLGLIEKFQEAGIRSSAVCHPMGSAEERQRLQDAVSGRVLFTPLYWMTKKIRAPLWKRPLQELRQLWRTGLGRKSAQLVADFAQAQRAELIHTNTITNPEGAYAARRLSVPHVWHLRELLGPGQPFRLPYEGPAFGHYMRANCSKLVANSHASAALVRDWLPAGLLEIVPNGIDLSQFTPRADWSHPAPVVVGMVGNITSRVKKHALFIEAAARMPRDLPVEFRIYGTDPSRGGTLSGDSYADGLHRQLERLGMKERFRWPGFVSEPAQIMREIDVLVQPHEAESFGRVAVEAMAAGLPVVGVRGGGGGEIVEHEVTGLLAEPNDPEQLAQHIERLVRDAAMQRRFGEAGRARAEQRYSLEACAAAILKVYEQVMSHREAAPFERLETP